MRIAGIKLLDRGKVRRDVFDAITNMTRQPELVGSDLKCEIAANNVARANWNGYLSPYAIDWNAITTNSIVGLVITLLVMIAGACLGGFAGERWLHRDVTTEERRSVPG